MREWLPALVEFVLFTITLSCPPLLSSAQGSTYTTLRKYWFYWLPLPLLTLLSHSLSSAWHRISCMSSASAASSLSVGNNNHLPVNRALHFFTSADRSPPLKHKCWECSRNVPGTSACKSVLPRWDRSRKVEWLTQSHTAHGAEVEAQTQASELVVHASSHLEKRWLQIGPGDFPCSGIP